MSVITMARPLQQLTHQVGRAIVMTDIVDRQNVGVVQRCDSPCLLLESAQPVTVTGKGLRQNLERDIPPQPRIPGAIDLAHSACSQQGIDLIGAKFCARSQGHPCGDYISLSVELRGSPEAGSSSTGERQRLRTIMRVYSRNKGDSCHNLEWTL